MTSEAADSELLRQYAENASVAAFEELVGRHVDHVFSAALRRVNGDHALAKDVAQTVFVDFARKAGRIPADMPPSGWLHCHTGFVASKMIDKERRRRNREQEAATMNTIQFSTANDPEWSATAPLLDAAMDSLPSSDRDAIVLRFFEQKDFRSVGAALGMSDDSAQKKVSSAVDKLRAVLGRRGVVSSGGALAALMLANSVQAAPAAISSQIAAQSLAGAATASVAGGSLIETLAGLGTAARVQAIAALAGVVAVAGYGGANLLKPTPPPAETKVLVAPAIPDPVPVAPPVAPVNVPVGAPAAPIMDLEALIAAAAAEWRGGRDHVSANAAALAFVIQIEAAQMPEALGLAQALKDEPARHLLLKNLLSHWAETEPHKARDWALSTAAGTPRADLREALMTAWAGNDPDAVLGLASKSGSARFPQAPIDESAIATVFRTYALEDPSKAFGRLEIISQSRRHAAIRGILDTVRTEEQREKIDGLIAKIRREETRIQARRAMVEQWARRDPVAAAAYVDKAEPAWERTRLMDSLGHTWLQGHDPTVAAEWWVDHAPGADTLVKIINVWAQLDANAAGKWLGKQAPGPTSDAARRTFSRQVADRDPESALRWAETVSDSTMREDTIDHVFANWHLRNADAANAFLSNAGWPAERLQRLQNNTNKQ